MLPGDLQEQSASEGKRGIKQNKNATFKNRGVRFRNHTDGSSITIISVYNEGELARKILPQLEQGKEPEEELRLCKWRTSSSGM